MTRLIRLQPAAYTDQISDDGYEMTKLPYPFWVRWDGTMANLNPPYTNLLGFQADLAKQQIDLWWNEARDDPGKAIGMYAVTQDEKGGIAVHGTAIDSAEVHDDTPTS